jgi:hypothetical protein
MVRRVVILVSRELVHSFFKGILRKEGESLHPPSRSAPARSAVIMNRDDDTRTVAGQAQSRIRPSH